MTILSNTFCCCSHFFSTGDIAMNAPDNFFLPDIQARADLRQLAIHKVGVKGLRYPLTLDSTRIRAELGYAAIVPEIEALRRTIDWEQQAA